jgi:hypothetical protein
MPRFAHGLLASLALFMAATAAPAQAAELSVKPGIAGHAVRHGRLATVVPPGVAYGCKRVWRCDAQVCEWRRGCWGVYGYVEGPYFSVALARRQWTREGLPGPGR